MSFVCYANPRSTKEPSHIFITHTHADHTTFLSNYVENEYKKAPPIYVPHEALPFVKAYLEAHYAMTQMTIEAAKPLDLSCLHPVTPGEEFRIKSKGGDDFFVTPILADHRVTCYGYSFVRLKRKLKDEYTKLNGRELGKLRKEGVNIYETVREPAFCYIGDSTTKVFDMNPEILRQHSVVVTECSFIAEKDVKRAEETQHTHWNHLKPIVESNPNTLFVLIHFTLKHSALSFLEFFNKETGDKHRNVHPMLVEHEVNGEWRKRKKNNHKGNAPNCMCFRCSP